MIILFDVEILIGYQLNNLGVNYNYFGPSKRPHPGSIFDIRSVVIIKTLYYAYAKLDSVL